MKFIRLVTVLAALLVSAQAGASPLTFSFKATLESDVDWVGLVRVYPGGTVVDGQFQIDENIAGTDYPNMTYYNGAFSGYAHIGDNTIHFADSLAYTHDLYPGYTIITMLGGNAWNTGGSIAENQPPAGYNVNGLQLRFTFEGTKPTNTPVRSLFADSKLLSSSFYVGYGIENNLTHANWGDITEIRKVPEPSTGFLMGLGLIGLLAIHKRQRQA